MQFCLEDLFVFCSVDWDKCINSVLFVIFLQLIVPLSKILISFTNTRRLQIYKSKERQVLKKWVSVTLNSTFSAGRFRPIRSPSFPRRRRLVSLLSHPVSVQRKAGRTEEGVRRHRKWSHRGGKPSARERPLLASNGWRWLVFISTETYSADIFIFLNGRTITIECFLGTILIDLVHTLWVKSVLED